MLTFPVEPIIITSLVEEEDQLMELVAQGDDAAWKKLLEDPATSEEMNASYRHLVRWHPRYKQYRICRKLLFQKTVEFLNAHRWEFTGKPLPYTSFHDAIFCATQDALVTLAKDRSRKRRHTL